jgi:ribose transport system substrate-binding protein
MMNVHRTSVIRRVMLPMVSVLALAGCSGAEKSGEKAKREDKGLTIAVIPKGTTHEFWKSIHAGAVQAANELSASGDSIHVIWKGPLREDDREQQVQVVEGFISQRVDGLVLAPLDDRALARPVEEAQAAGVPTVIIDSRLESDAIVSYVATDNAKGGELAAERLGALLGGKGKVLVLRLQEGSASTTAREDGFLSRLAAQYPGITVVSSNQYAGATRETAKQAAENLLNRFGADLQGIFTPNESSTIGMLLALQDIGKAGRIRFVGFDATQTLIDAMKAGQLDGFAVQNPMRMGYLGVKTMVAHLRGEALEKRIDTGVTMVTPENLVKLEVQELIHPPIDKYLTGS